MYGPRPHKAAFGRLRLQLHMAILLDTQRDFRRVYKHTFCYICGRALVDDEVLNDDHVPPSGIFAVADRQPPLILRTHKSCNTAQSADDQVISQLVGAVRGRQPSGKNRKLNIRLQVVESGETTAILRGQAIDHMVQRWLRGFHAALYRELLPPAPQTGFMTILPFPQTTQDGEILRPDPIPAAHAHFLKTIEQHKAADTTDRIVCRNGKCRYDCTWTQADEADRWLCIYRLDLYNWSELGDVNNFERRQCVGAYTHRDGSAPDTAAKVRRSDRD